ncbi:hypothetical protein LGM71_24225 [Burkholderia sp. AU33545]|uniref:hypothetical protein n=1 Tax=Burkholderia sp. AU33545 TaxID=2879631 RepID=UPI001CF32C8D|nr:hypothetical protein [Burkholderia sp. AU33545]MCA8204156.1 hypothetical protein [Burkholderia sp. AU33545]
MSCSSRIAISPADSIKCSTVTKPSVPRQTIVELIGELVASGAWTGITLREGESAPS